MFVIQDEKTKPQNCKMATVLLVRYRHSQGVAARLQRKRFLNLQCL